FTGVPSGANKVRFITESTGAPSHSETATLAMGPPDHALTMLVDSIVPTSGTLVTLLLSKRIAAAAGPPVFKVNVFTNKPRLELTVNCNLMGSPQTKVGNVEIWNEVE